MVHSFLFPYKCPYSRIYPWVSKFSLGHFWGNKLVHSFIRKTVLNSIHISLRPMWVKSCNIKWSANALMWSLTPCISARLYKKTLRGDWRTLFALMSYSTNTISWSARPTGGIFLTLVTGVGLFISRMSRVWSCHVADMYRKTPLVCNYYCWQMTTVNHFIFACSLFRDFLIENMFAEIEIHDAWCFLM